MTIWTTPLGRRAVLKGSTAALATLAMPAIVRGAEPAPIKVGVLQPVTGALAMDGEYGRTGAEFAIAAVNAAGGIKSLGGAKLEMVFGDARSNPEAGTQEVERMQGEGVVAVVGGFASGICLAASQTAARYDLPYLVDVGVSDQIVQRGLKNTFRFGPGFGVCTRSALDNLARINEAAGKPAKTVVLVHEDGLFGSGLAKVMQAELPKLGFEILDTIPVPTPSRDLSNVVLRLRSLNPDIVMPSTYYGETVLLARTMQQQRVRPKAVYGVLNGAASNMRFVKEFPEAADKIMDCNHWYDPRKAGAQALLKAVADAGKGWNYNLPMNYSCVGLLADALERAGSTDRAKVIDALAASTWADHVMPYGPTKFVDGQNQGAAPVSLQVQNGAIRVVYPEAFSDAKAIFPVRS
ncbi:branched-chain amino acid transport system substrate-binding protein [Azorhizobium caulinodans ORS 571]|uniref:Branched-chain amino acid transport system substrate-binding protein n=1 Tax=Azorhizobium caulinodans (strain ATCC 43989 / DSM 5975 / JCM 20966 / LMG 6465 / NBRC 14845 / NCIMB 13405 / ORS 571) TaxID=438753 RepID=A8I7D5_AZOC5|nr:ABC transporter substrate-binding protein [Azorhizobium caulinodans]BAF88107.1 branched-chain amino acid transport system substrate-binding protein [Azorhizobium caulinodans ORS 571]